MPLKSYVISLNDMHERRSHIKKVFGNLNLIFQFQDAIDITLKSDFLKNNSIEVKNTTLSEGEIACFLSHFSLWKLLVENDLEFIAVFEDDIYLANDTFNLFTNLEWLPNKFDVIKLETMYERVFCQINTELLNNRYLAKMASRHMGGAGYIISKTGALKLINKTIKSGIESPVDHLIFDWLIHEHNQVYQLLPAICIQDKVYNKSNSLFDSSLEEKRIARPKKKKLKGMKKINRELNRLKNNLITNQFIVYLYLKFKGYKKEIIEYSP